MKYITFINQAWNWLKITLFLYGLLHTIFYLNNLYADWYYTYNEVTYSAKQCEQVANDLNMARIEAAQGIK